MRTINGAELFEASDAELRSLCDPRETPESTWETRQRAQSELDRRRLDSACTCGGRGLCLNCTLVALEED